MCSPGLMRDVVQRGLTNVIYPLIFMYSKANTFKKVLYGKLAGYIMYCLLVNANFYVGCILPWFATLYCERCSRANTRCAPWHTLPILQRQQMGQPHCLMRLAISSNSCRQFHGKAHRESPYWNVLVCKRQIGPALALLIVTINNGVLRITKSLHLYHWPQTAQLVSCQRDQGAVIKSHDCRLSYSAKGHPVNKNHLQSFLICYSGALEIKTSLTHYLSFISKRVSNEI